MTTQRSRFLALLATAGLAASAQGATRGHGKIAYVSVRNGNVDIFVLAADGTAPVRLTPAPVVDPFFNDRTVRVGVRYRYTVRSVDRAGNESSPSPPVIAEPF